jgi:hypothetical protein
VTEEGMETSRELNTPPARRYQRTHRALPLTSSGPRTMAHQSDRSPRPQVRRTGTAQNVARQNQQQRSRPGQARTPARQSANQNRNMSPNNATATLRERSTAIRRASQSSQASAMIATNRNSITPIHRGDFVTIFPNDNRDQGGHSRNGVQGIVINTPKKPGYAIAVVTKYGIMGTRNEWGYIKNQQYQKAHGTQPLDDKMIQLKREVMSSLSFNHDGRHKVRSMREITRQAANRGSQTRPKRVKCGCKSLTGGLCSSNRCLCRIDGAGCNARCGCRGNCTNP